MSILHALYYNVPASPCSLFDQSQMVNEIWHSFNLQIMLMSDSYFFLIDCSTAKSSKDHSSQVLSYTWRGPYFHHTVKWLCSETLRGARVVCWDCCQHVEDNFCNILEQFTSSPSSEKCQYSETLSCKQRMFWL